MAVKYDSYSSPGNMEFNSFSLGSCICKQIKKIVTSHGPTYLIRIPNDCNLIDFTADLTIIIILAARRKFNEDFKTHTKIPLL